MNSTIEQKSNNKNSSNIQLKKILYVVLIGIHITLFGFFLFLSYQNLLLTILESSFILVLIIGLLYTYLIKNPYHFYFYIGIVMGSVIVAFIIPLILIIVIPEIIYFSYLSQRKMSTAQILGKMRSQRWYLSRGLRMNEVWNPKNIRTNVQLNDKEKLQKEYSILTIGIINFICTLGFLISSILTVILYFF